MEATTVEESTPATAASGTEAAPERLPVPPRYRSREERDIKLLAGGIADPETILWLTTESGPTTDSEKFLALYETEFSGQPQGAILLLHAEGQHPNWPQTIEPIRKQLPASGWSTLAVAVPMPAIPKPPARDAAAESKFLDKEPLDKESLNKEPPNKEPPNKLPPDKEPLSKTVDTEREAAPKETEEGEKSAAPDSAPLQDNTTSKSEMPRMPLEEPNAEARALARLAAAMRFLNGQGLFNIVVIGDGMGATRASQFFRTLDYDRDGEGLKPLQAMIIINARNHFPQGDFNFLQGLHDPGLAILDIYFGNDPRDRREAQKRKRFALRHRFVAYQQLHQPELPPTLSGQDNRLSRRVRGFLAQHARGQKLDKAKLK